MTQPPDPRQDQPPAQAPGVPARRWLRWLLVLSLALNLVVAGLVAGLLLSGAAEPGQMRRVDLSLGPLTRALDPADRRAVRDDLRMRAAAPPPHRDSAGALEELVAVLRRDSFDVAAIREVFALQRRRGAVLQQAGQEALIARLAAMTPQERRAYADRVAAEMRGVRRGSTRD